MDLKKDIPSTPTASVMERPPLTSHKRGRPSVVSSNPSTAPPQEHGSSASTESQTKAKKSIQPTTNEPGLISAALPSESASEPDSNKTPASTPADQSSAQITKPSAVSKLTAAPPASAGDRAMDPSASSSSAPDTSSTAPKKIFVSMAKRVIMQERLRKAEEEDTHDEDEDEEPEEDLTVEQIETKAQSGDATAQTQLGQHYLILAKEKDPEQNNVLAVNWLIKAAKQGKKNAAKALQRCWVQRTGITSENEADVRKLSTESKFERTVRKAARMMFLKLNPERKNKVAMSEMLENVSQVNAVPGGNASKIPSPTTGQTQRVLENMVINESKQLVDLDDFVEMTKNYAQGIVPSQNVRPDQRESFERQDSSDEHRRQSVSSHCKKSPKIPWSFGGGGMMLDTERTGAMRRAMDMSRITMLQYPLHTFMDAKEHLVDWASRAGVQWLSTIIPTQHVNALIFFFIISNLTVDLFAFVIPLLVFYLSFISMIICTLRVFKSSKTWENFSALTSLLTRFEPSLDVEQAETNFGLNNLEQYFYFIISVFFVIFSFPVADKGWIPCSELSTVAIFFTAVSYMSLSPTAAMYARQALVIEVASSLCSLTQFLPKNMTALRFLGHTFATLPLGESVVLKLSLPCLLYVYLFYLFFSMAKTRGFRGEKVYNSTLTWNQYSQACGPPAWETKGMAQTQIFCSHLYGHRVTWTGRFKHVRVAETENGPQSVINILPKFIGDWLRCLYGETYPKCEPKNVTVTNQTAADLAAGMEPSHHSLTTLLRIHEEEELCQIKALAKHTCHVKRFDSFRFEVTVGMVQADDPTKDVLLMASNEFRQVLLNLNPGNMVEFSTKLEGRLGAKAPAFELKAIDCLDCVSSAFTGGRQVKIERNWRRTTMRALKFGFDFFFAPFLSANISA
ncbi:wolframin isoform X3 [Cynoglossus semilaevis]|uniref:wolframin isoform X3 n=1 Tax=Cynoglossus semilaevis TaxID=244447 RepID=UPI000D6296D4|nr:wolframin-like isoform X3 [Cynoglossus semilaevis]